MLARVIGKDIHKEDRAMFTEQKEIRKEERKTGNMKSMKTGTREKSEIDKTLISSLLNHLILKEKLDGANAVLDYLLKVYPNDFWLLTKKSSVYHEMHDYKKALEFSKKALAQNANSPLVLWDYACNLDMMGKEKEAIAAWEKIISFGVQEVALHLTEEGKEWAESLINDSLLRISVSYFEIGEQAIAVTYLRKYLANRKSGQASIYSEKEMREMIHAVSKKKFQQLGVAA